MVAEIQSSGFFITSLSFNTSKGPPFGIKLKILYPYPTTLSEINQYRQNSKIFRRLQSNSLYVNMHIDLQGHINESDNTLPKESLRKHHTCEKKIKHPSIYIVTAIVQDSY